MDVRQIEAGELNVGYVDAGPDSGPAMLLLHGWPYDIHAFDEVTPRLVEQGYRVIVPYLRGYGTTRFLAEETARNGEQVAFALDATALMDALEIERTIVAGFDWGSRTAAIMAALWPERCAGLVAVSGYLIGSVEFNQEPLPPKAELGWWYQYYFSTERGRLGYSRYRHDFNKLIWQIASPRWGFDDATYARTAASFDNPDHVDIVIHNYRWRLGLADGDEQHLDAEQKLAARPTIDVPTITIASDFDGPNADGRAYADRFTGPHEHRILDGIGHDVPQEAPTMFADALIGLAHQESARPGSRW
ncbi:alpha/beta fold hydrolase [Actinomycetospora sp. CA-101289]|uniref:alpha/beta fold hydrolase n=1 Tax=Actinomycetospora sp. CA-101289 TaxID=3239893 RepID=UPI003D996BE1